MDRIFAFSDSSDSRDILNVLTTWSAHGFIDSFFVALGSDDSASGPLEIVHLRPEGVQTLTLDQTMSTLNDIPMVIQVCLGRQATGTQLGKRTADEMQKSILRFADANQRFQKTAVLATDSPVTPLDLGIGDTPSARFFLVPEDRTRPMSPIGHLSSEQFASHVAAGIVSLCGLWNQHTDIKSTTRMNAAIDQALAEGQQGSPDMLFLYRNFVRILQLPTLVTNIVNEANSEFGKMEYPNPDQVKFERSSLAPYIRQIAETYVAAFPEIQVGEPALIPPLIQEKAKKSLVRAIRELLDQVLQQLALKPAEFVDHILGSYYDHLAKRVESLVPNGNVEVLRWRELGESGKASALISSEISQTFDRLAESDVAPAWIAYRELALGLLDGQQNNGTKLVTEQLFISSADRQVITPFPGEVVHDPLAHAVSPSEDSEPEGETTEDQVPDAESQIEARGNSFESLNLTQAIRQKIESAINTSTTRIEEIQKKRIEESSPEFKESVAREQSESERINRKMGRSVRGTFTGIFASVALAAYGAFFTHHTLQGWESYLAVAGIVSGPILLVAAALGAQYVGGLIVATVSISALVSDALNVGFKTYLISLGAVVTVLSPLLLAMSIWKSAKIQSKFAKQKMESARVRVNEVLEEAHHLSATKRLSRRLDEFDDWSSVVGLVAHHPFEFGVDRGPSLSKVDFKFPQSICFGTGQISDKNMELLMGSFRRELIPEGWLNQRFNELRVSVLDSLRAKVGTSRELSSTQVEGNTSTDKDSPRKLYFTVLSEIMKNQGGGPLLSRLTSSMRDISVTDFCDEVVFELPNGLSEKVKSSEFLETDLLHEGTLLHSHWAPGGKIERSKVALNFRFGELSHLNLTTDAIIKPPTVIVGTVQMTSRISPDTLNAFPKAK
jgi:hypothetical protein